MTVVSVPDKIAEKPPQPISPSARLVALVLAENGEQTPKQLAERTGLPSRTIRDAIRRLGDYVESRPNLEDSRQDLYSFSPSPEASASSNNDS